MGDAPKPALMSLRDLPMKLHVHVGVHKTATTYLQGRLASNGPKLNSAGIGVMPLGPFRQFFTRNLMKYPAETFRIENHVEKFFPGGVPAKIHGLILSDENLIGLCNGLVSTGKAYQRADIRLSHLKRLLAGHRITMFMAVRSYDTFTSSAYCEAMRHTEQFSSFDSFRARLDLEALRWPTLVRFFSEALKPAEIKLWRFEDFREQSDRVCRELAFGREVDEAAEDSRLERASLSGAAIKALETVAVRLGPSAAAGLVSTMNDALPKGKGKGEYPAFEPWSDEERRTMIKLYDEDCRSIPDSYWIVPPESPTAVDKAPISAVA
jgi:hypothetical protein